MISVLNPFDRPSMGVGSAFGAPYVMLSLLYIGLIIAVVLAAVLARAVATAPEGFEDDRGFHEIVAEGSESGSADPSIVRPKHAKRDLPSVAATR